MNAGFSNYATLRAHVLGNAISAGTVQFDAALQLIGLGMAKAVEKYLNRKLMRVVGEVEILPADYASFSLSRYPVESITQISLNVADGNGWVVQNIDPTSNSCFYNSINTNSGLVLCPDQADVGPYYAQVQFTYNGGFFWEQLEPSDAGYPTQQPAGSFALPDDIQLAWLTQCQAFWSKRDKLGLGLIDKPDEQSKLDDLKLLPLVKEMLDSHRRIQMV